MLGIFLPIMLIMTNNAQLRLHKKRKIFENRRSACNYARNGFIWTGFDAVILRLPLQWQHRQGQITTVVA